jgi:cytochrome oxidase Cu insertion factor (SCO1/SenC/PrrC family)
MKRSGFKLGILLSILLLLSAQPLVAVEVGDKAPEFELPSTRGGKLKLSNLRGQNVLVNFYYTDYSPT